MSWPGFEASLWENLKSEAIKKIQKSPAIILGSDRDAGAIKISTQNAERAKVSQNLSFSQHAVSAMVPQAQKGFIVTNPPYGIRVSEGNDLRNLYAQLGNVLKANFQGWNFAILSSELPLLKQTGLRFDTSLSFSHGGLKVKLARGKV